MPRGNASPGRWPVPPAPGASTNANRNRHPWALDRGHRGRAPPHRPQRTDPTPLPNRTRVAETARAWSWRRHQQRPPTPGAGQGHRRPGPAPTPRGNAAPGRWKGTTNARSLEPASRNHRPQNPARKDTDATGPPHRQPQKAANRWHRTRPGQGPGAPGKTPGPPPPVDLGADGGTTTRLEGANGRSEPLPPHQKKHANGHAGPGFFGPACPAASEQPRWRPAPSPNTGNSDFAWIDVAAGCPIGSAQAPLSGPLGRGAGREPGASGSRPPKQGGAPTGRSRAALESTSRFPVTIRP